MEWAVGIPGALGRSGSRQREALGSSMSDNDPKCFRRVDRNRRH